MIIQSTTYAQYINKVQSHKPATESDGKVKEQVDYFKDQAFKEKPVTKSYEDDHESDQCARVHHALRFWQKRIKQASN